MCTIIVGYKLFPNEPIVLAANRDELIDRPAGRPTIDDAPCKTLAPTDLARGGTWIGVNDQGVFAALTNRADVPSVWSPENPEGMRTRGGLVRAALKHPTAADAIADIACDQARRFNGYHLVIGDAEELFIVVGGGVDGAEHPLISRYADAPGILVVTNLGIGPSHSPRSEAIMNVWNLDSLRLRRERPHRALWDRMLTIHDQEPRVGSDWMKRMASTCIHRPRTENYGTRSSAFIVLHTARGTRPHHVHPAEWRYWHRERPDGRHACHGRWDPARILQIKE